MKSVSRNSAQEVALLFGFKPIKRNLFEDQTGNRILILTHRDMKWFGVSKTSHTSIRKNGYVLMTGNRGVRYWTHTELNDAITKKKLSRSSDGHYNINLDDDLNVKTVDGGTIPTKAFSIRMSQ